MFIIEMTFSLAIGLLLTTLFGAGLRMRGPWESLFVFFCLVSLSAWAGGSWLSPRGPMLWGISWVPFLVVGSIVALFLAATPKRDTPAEKEEELEREEVILGNLFWILIGVLGAVIAAHYFNRHTNVA
jgi:hypothetical protein